MKKLNYLQIAFHTIGVWMLILSIYSFSGLYNIRILELLQKNGFEKIAHNAKKYALSPVDIMNVSLAKGLSISVVILIGTVFSIAVSVKNKWSLLNCLFVFLLSILISRLGLFNGVMRGIISPENVSCNLLYKYITLGILFLIIGISLFSLKKINRIIEDK